jgi:hypothetical protein
MVEHSRTSWDRQKQEGVRPALKEPRKIANLTRRRQQPINRPFSFTHNNLGTAVRLAVACTVLWVTSLGAQAVSAPEDEARTLPVGVFRLSVADSNAHYSELFGPGGRNVSLMPNLNSANLGVQQLPRLGPAQSAIQALTGNSSFQLSLGQVIADADIHVQKIPVSLEVGVTRWLTVRAMVPIVDTRTDVFLNVNPSRFTGNVSTNPAVATPAALQADRAVYNQFIHAASTLTQALATCRTNPAAAHCGAINADSGAIRSLINQGSSFATALATLYGGPSGAGALVVPVTGTSAQNTINSKDASLTSQINAVYGTLGLPALTTLNPYAAPAHAAVNDLQELITNPTLGYNYDTLQTVTRTGIGDAEISATVRLFDTFASDTLRFAPRGLNYRTAVTGLFRLGTGSPANPFSLTDPGTGTGENALEVHSATDVMFGKHLWASVILRGTYQLSDHLTMRIPTTPDEALTPAVNTTTVGRQLGNAISLEVDPRYVFNDYISASTTYVIRHQAADKYTGSLSLDSAETGYAPVQLNASTLGANTGYTSQTWGFGVTLSTVNAASRGKISWPVDVSYLHSETFASTGGLIPHQKSDAILIRLYVRLFGTVTQGQRGNW